MFSFTCRRVENPDSHIYVLGKRSNYLRASFPTFGYIIRHLQPKITNCISFEHVVGPSIVPKLDESSYMQSATFSSGTTTGFFIKSKFVLMISGKYSTDSSRGPPTCWRTSNAISSFRGKILEHSKISCLNCHFQFSSISTNALRVSMKSKIVLPLLCSFRKIKWLFSRLGTILFFPWSLPIDFNSYPVELHTARCVHLSLLLCILNLACYVWKFKHTGR